MITRHNVTTYSHRDYSANGSPTVISKAEAADRIHKFNEKYKAGKITAGERAAFTEAMSKRVCP